MLQRSQQCIWRSQQCVELPNNVGTLPTMCLALEHCCGHSVPRRAGRRKTVLLGGRRDDPSPCTTRSAVHSPAIHDTGRRPWKAGCLCRGGSPGPPTPTHGVEIRVPWYRGIRERREAAVGVAAAVAETESFAVEPKHTLWFGQVFWHKSWPFRGKGLSIVPKGVSAGGERSVHRIQRGVCRRAAAHRYAAA